MINTGHKCFITFSTFACFQCQSLLVGSVFHVTLNVLHHIIPHKLCRVEVNYKRCLQKVESVCFSCFGYSKKFILITWIFQQHSIFFFVHSLQEWGLGLESFTTDTRMLRVKKILVLAEKWHLNDKYMTLLITHITWKRTFGALASGNDPSKDTERCNC